ncbi:MAG: hypothetical protein WA584_21210 [Pyrinomonadaceae bacterium]
MFARCSRIICCIGFIYFLGTLPLYGQKNDCRWERDEKGNKVIVCKIAENNPFPLGPVRISNDGKVVVRITNKSPFDECTLAEIKLTEIKESDPIATILQLFTRAATGSSLASPAAANVSGTRDTNTLAGRLFNETVALAFALDMGISSSKTLIELKQKPLLEKVNTFVSSPPRSAGDFKEKEGDDLIQKLDAEVKAGEAKIDIDDGKNENERTDNTSLERLLVESQTKYNGISEQIKAISNDEQAADVIRALSLVSVKLNAFKLNYESITSARALFKTVLKILNRTRAGLGATPDSKQDPFAQELAFLPYNQQIATTTVSCTNVLSKKLTTAQIPIIFHFKNDPNLSVSVGPLLSTIPKQKLGTTPINTGLNISGASTFRSEFAVVDKTSYQIVPFTFLNYRFFEFGRGSNPVKPSLFSLNFSAGIGLNPNSGNNEVEYFVGGAIGFKRYMIQFGDHIGRFQEGFNGGFNIGDTVPANFPSTLPIRKVYRHGFGIAFSYRLTF